MAIGITQGKGNKVFRYIIESHISGNLANRRKGEALLNDISEELCRIEDSSFSNGLAGIGWMIEFFNQNGLLEIDTNEVLADFDDEIYKIAMQSLAETKLNLTDIQKLNFFLVRSSNKTGLYYKKFIHREVLLLYGTHLSNQLTQVTLAKLKNNGRQIFYAKILMQVCYLTVTGIPGTYTEEGLYHLVNLFIQYYEQKINDILTTEGDIILKHLEVCGLVTLACKQYKNQFWEDYFLECYMRIKKIVEESNASIAETETCNLLRWHTIEDRLFLTKLFEQPSWPAIVINYLTTYQPFSSNFINGLSNLNSSDLINNELPVNAHS